MQLNALAAVQCGHGRIRHVDVAEHGNENIAVMDYAVLVITKNGGKKNVIEKINRAFREIVNSNKNKQGVRLQRKRFVIMYMGWPYTFTIERGDRLNDRSVD